MNIILLNKDVKRATTLLESGNQKALDNMFLTFMPEYIILIRSKLKTRTQYLFDNMFL